MTDRVGVYRLIIKGKHIRRFYPLDAPTPEGWVSYYTATPIDFGALKRYSPEETF